LDAASACFLAVELPDDPPLPDLDGDEPDELPPPEPEEPFDPEESGLEEVLLPPDEFEVLLELSFFFATLSSSPRKAFGRARASAAMNVKIHRGFNEVFIGLLFQSKTINRNLRLRFPQPRTIYPSVTPAHLFFSLAW
jgi:hypothetical protein